MRTLLAVILKVEISPILALRYDFSCSPLWGLLCHTLHFMMHQMFAIPDKLGAAAFSTPPLLPQSHDVMRTACIWHCLAEVNEAFPVTDVEACDPTKVCHSALMLLSQVECYMKGCRSQPSSNGFRLCPLCTEISTYSLDLLMVLCRQWNPKLFAILQISQLFADLQICWH